MTRPTEIRIDRLVLPAGERHCTVAFRAALERSLASQIAGDTIGGGQSSLAERTARVVAERIGKVIP